MTTPGSTNPIPHLWFVITEPDPQSDSCVIVSLTTLRNDKDQTVTLSPSDHPFISHPSVVHYHGALIVNVSAIRKLLAGNTIQQHEACTAKTLKLIQEGVSASEFTPKKIESYCKLAWQAAKRQESSIGTQPFA